MASKRRQDEKHLNLLRGMVKLEYNKECFDCNQKGPTYVDMAVGAFVCTTCSGLLRGLNPPHRVKSISMASFTPDEIEFIKARGNHFCQKVWLGLHNRSHFDFDNKDENKLKDFMTQKYEKKRYYVAPTEQMHEDARKLNTPAKTEPTKRQLRPMGQVPKLAQNNIIVSQNRAPLEVPKPVSIDAPISQPRHTQQPRVDLLTDLGADPFQSHKPAVAQNQSGFADFGAFGGTPTQQTQPVVPTQHHPAAFPAPSAGLLTPMSSQGQPPVSSQQQSLFGAFAACSIAPPSAGGGDKYSALADLDSEFGNPPSTAPPVPVQWNSNTPGGGGQVMYWGGSVPVNSQSSSSTSVLSTSSVVSSNSTGFNAVANPFGGVSQPASQPLQANPFAASPGFSQHAGTAYIQAGAGFSQAGFGATGFVQSPSGAGGGFGGQMSAVPFQGNPAQFGMPNGSSGAPQGWGQTVPQAVPQGQMAAFGALQNNSMMGTGGFVQKVGTPQGVYGMSPHQQGFTGWGAAQPTANPFMNIANQAAPAKATNSTNPFL